jgi:ribosomal protein S18 acetylase RimI-like enzyme
MGPFSIVPAATNEMHFAQRVSRENMEKYYTATGRGWDAAIFEASWPATENYAIFSRDVPIGILRLRPDADAIYISDLQIATGSQGRGAGTFALDFVCRIARERAVTRIRLRAFTGSAAIRLYQRAGFRKIADETGKQLFERAL